MALESDHSLLEYTLSLETPRIHETRPAWRRVDWDHFRPTLRTALATHCPSPMALQSPTDIDALATALDTALQDTAARHVPLSHRGGHRSHSWWSPHLGELKAKLTRARRRWQSTRLPADKSIVNACSRELRKAVAAARQKSWVDFCENTSEQNIWDQFQRISRPHRPQRTADLFVDNTWITDDIGKAEALGQSFFPDNQPIQDPFHCQVEAEVEAILSTPHSQDPPPVTSRELHDAISAPGPWKAPGPDGIPYACLSHCEDMLAPYLLPLFTASLHLAHIPTAWKVARVVAVPKPGRDPTSPKGYRPISLNPCISKVLERILSERLTYFLETGLHLPQSQYGFRKGRSTELAPWRFVTAATQALQERHSTALLSLDIQSAYDRVWHKGLIRKLATLGVPPSLLAWLLAFLSDRRAHVRVKGAVCTRSLTLGVPQGSPLSPILFLVFVGDLLSCLQ